MSRHLVTGGAERERDESGRWKRMRHVWTPEDWDEGHLNNQGRFVVYRPDYPKAYAGGRALRSHVIYWLTTGEPVPTGFDVHHRNRVRNDDRLANLELLPHDDHSRHHNPRVPRVLICEHCGVEFSVNHKRGKRPTRFCSQACYHAHPRASEHKAAISVSLAQAYTEGRR